MNSHGTKEEYNMYKLTDVGLKEVGRFIAECLAMQKEILDAKSDTTNNTNIPTIDDIECSIGEYIEEDGDYYDCWGVTDDYSSGVLSLHLGIDFVEISAEENCEGKKFFTTMEAAVTFSNTIKNKYIAGYKVKRENYTFYVVEYEVS